MDEKIYTDPLLSLDMFTGLLGINRYYISQAINRCSGKNFRTFVNEYRVNEAIQLITNPRKPHLTIDSIAFESGFSDRKNFHRVFKKMTGNAPATFREESQTDTTGDTDKKIIYIIPI